MNSSVTRLSEMSVMSSSCLLINESSRSNGPSKLPRATENAGAAAALGDGATDDQFPRDLHVGLGRGVLRRKLGDRNACDAGIRELHRAADDRLEHAIAERVDDALEDLT